MALSVFVPLLLLFGVTADRDVHGLSPDPVAAAMASWQLAERGNLTLDAPPVTKNPWIVDAGDRQVSNRQPGIIAAGVPAYVITKPFTDGFSLWPSSMTAATSAAGACALLALVLVRLGARPRAAVLAALVGGTCTGTWSVSADALWTHGPNQLLLSAALLALLHRRWWLLGLLLGAAVPVRTHLAVVALVLGVVASRRTSSARPLLQVGLPAAAGLAAVVGYTHHVFGVWSVNAGYVAFGGYPSAALASSSASGTSYNLVAALLTPDRGLLLCSPFLLALLLGLPAGWRRAPWEVRAAALAGVAYLVVQMRLNDYTGGARFWGSRLTIETLTLAAPLLWLAWRNWACADDGRRRGVLALVTLTGALQLCGAVLHEPSGFLMDDWTHWNLYDLLDYSDEAPVARLVVLAGVAGAAACLFGGRRRDPSRPTPLTRPVTPAPVPSPAAPVAVPSSAVPAQRPGAAASTRR